MITESLFRKKNIAILAVHFLEVVCRCENVAYANT